MFVIMPIIIPVIMHIIMPINMYVIIAKQQTHNEHVKHTTKQTQNNLEHNRKGQFF